MKEKSTRKIIQKNSKKFSENIKNETDTNKLQEEFGKFNSFAVKKMEDIKFGYDKAKGFGFLAMASTILTQFSLIINGGFYPVNLEQGWESPLTKLATFTTVGLVAASAVKGAVTLFNESKAEKAIGNAKKDFDKKDRQINREENEKLASMVEGTYMSHKYGIKPLISKVNDTVVVDDSAAIYFDGLMKDVEDVGNEQV